MVPRVIQRCRCLQSWRHRRGCHPAAPQVPCQRAQRGQEAQNLGGVTPSQVRKHRQDRAPQRPSRLFSFRTRPSRVSPTFRPWRLTGRRVTPSLSGSGPPHAHRPTSAPGLSVREGTLPPHWPSASPSKPSLLLHLSARSRRILTCMPRARAVSGRDAASMTATTASCLHGRSTPPDHGNSFEVVDPLQGR